MLAKNNEAASQTMKPSDVFDAVSVPVTKIEAGEITRYLTDYRNYNGVTMYFRKISLNGYAVVMRIQGIEWTINRPVDDSIFTKPAESRAASRNQ